MMRRSFFFFLAISLTMWTAACDDGEKVKPFGSPCTIDDSCNALCNLSLPGGMCVIPCDEASPCKTGSCIDFGPMSYCMPPCAENTDCREGYTCWSGHCRPLASVGELCEETEDCKACADDTSCPDGGTIECREGVCSIECGNDVFCPAGTYCGYSTDAYWCIPVDFSTEPGGAGDSCAADNCATGFTCFSAYDGDVLAYCTMECDTGRDCPPDMLCRDPGDGTPICMPREFCESCDMDIQCGYQTDRCLANDPAVDAGGRYCSRLCDPDRAGSCPLDSTCREAFYCDSLGAWVADCAWCDGNCGPGNLPEYQCFHDYGTCVGEGELCSPCHINDECDNGYCLSLRGVDNYVCSEPCDRDTFCDDGYMCVSVGSTHQCLPRSGSCSKPSNNVETCRMCGEWEDCLRGVCLPPDGNMNNPSYCLDECIDNSDCDPYSTCDTLTIYGTYNFKVCLPNVTVGTCSNWINCDTQCPDGPENCPDGPAYCQ